MDKKDSTNDDMILFGVDFGLKKIGIAIGQNVTKRASPLTIIYNKKDVINWDELEKIIKKWSPKVLIVGQPVVRKENNFTKALDTFNKELSKRYGNRLKIIKYSEELTTEESKHIYREMRQNQEKINKKYHLDDLAASIILQSWLNENMIS